MAGLYFDSLLRLAKRGAAKLKSLRRMTRAYGQRLGPLRGEVNRPVSDRNAQGGINGPVHKTARTVRGATLWRRVKWAVSHFLVNIMDYTVTRRLNFGPDR